MAIEEAGADEERDRDGQGVQEGVVVVLYERKGCIGFVYTSNILVAACKASNHGMHINTYFN